MHPVLQILVVMMMPGTETDVRDETERDQNQIVTVLKVQVMK